MTIVLERCIQYRYTGYSFRGGVTLKRAFLETAEFRIRWKKLGLTDQDLKEVQSFLIENPRIAPVIQGTGGIRKLRFSLEGIGKRGGARILYFDYPECEWIALLYAYPKNMKDDISPSEKKILKGKVESLKAAIRKSFRQGYKYE